MGLSGLSDRMRQAVEQRIVELLELRVGAKVAAQMPEWVAEAASEDDVDDDDARKVIEKYVPNVGLLTAEELRLITAEFNARYEAHIRGARR